MNESAAHLDPALLVAYQEDDLDASERATVKSHLEKCGACHAELALAQEVSSIPQGADMGKLSKDLGKSFALRLQDRLGGETRSIQPGARKVTPVRGRRSFWLAGGLLAASLAVFAIGFYQLRQPPEPKDFGRTVRTGSTRASLSFSLQQSSSDTWELQYRIDRSLQDPVAVITTASGNIVFERKLEGTNLSIQRSELKPYPENTVLFVQIMATDTLGNRVKSRPERLPQ